MTKRELKILAKELREEGFTPDEVEEIIMRIECGHSVDSAIQDVFTHR